MTTDNLFDLFNNESQNELSDSSSAESKKMIDELVSKALAYRSGKQLKELLDFIKMFPHIAPYNAMLLHVQNPGIRFALRTSDWEKKYHRRVKPASRPYVILRTMGPVDFVYDLSDTEPIDPSFDWIPDLAKNPFPVKGEPPPYYMQFLINSCEELRIRIEFRDYATAQAGQIQPILNDFYKFQVTLNSKHTEAQKFATTIHELGHLFCGHLGKIKNGFWQDRQQLSIAARELEAEAVAYLVTERLNLDVGSVEYLADYLHEGKQLPNYSLDAILKATSKIEEMIQGKFRPKKNTYTV